MSASKALDHIRRHGSPRDLQTALYYVTRGRTAHLLELARAVTPALEITVIESPGHPTATDSTTASAVRPAPMDILL